MDLYVIRRPSAWANLQELEAAGAKSARIGNDEMSDRVRWIRSYVVHEPDGRNPRRPGGTQRRRLGLGATRRAVVCAAGRPRSIHRPHHHPPLQGETEM